MPYTNYRCLGDESVASYLHFCPASSYLSYLTNSVSHYKHFSCNLSPLATSIPVFELIQ
jgi:hypothetical protein